MTRGQQTVVPDRLEDEQQTHHSLATTAKVSHAVKGTGLLELETTHIEDLSQPLCRPLVSRKSQKRARALHMAPLRRQ